MPGSRTPAPRGKIGTLATSVATDAKVALLPMHSSEIQSRDLDQRQTRLKHEADRPVAESPVTIADRNAEAAMRRLIEARYPAHGIVGEEFGSLRPDAEWCWVATLMAMLIMVVQVVKMVAI